MIVLNCLDGLNVDELLMLRELDWKCTVCSNSNFFRRQPVNSQTIEILADLAQKDCNLRCQ